MSNPSDFIIENGVLTKYVGLGGDVEIPEGVTEIGKDALKGQNIETVTIPESIDKIDSQGLANAGIKVLRVQGKIEKGMFGKNALKGNGTGENCKGLTIVVDSKKDAKALKKQLKKAGAKSAKVVVKK